MNTTVEQNETAEVTGVETDTYPTQMIFRKYANGDIIALMPEKLLRHPKLV